ncbi:hypothetical protein K3M67_17885 (plasmid) [Sphingobium sp. V4]|uniref:hypothetical protein n=1 Tax=Sphingobium sp. V4 TaxID=3038927 RepID=UPI00255836A9|nr:hypothetical protein [Sphingobium sp. V4]WIW91115.1 hypothetical protein K3M67_17885 [Sphingobium sp. V4]
MSTTMTAVVAASTRIASGRAGNTTEGPTREGEGSTIAWLTKAGLSKCNQWSSEARICFTHPGWLLLTIHCPEGQS